MSLQKQLVGHWKLDKDTPYDSSAYDRHATKNGGVTTGENGKINGAYGFNGTDSSLEMNYDFTGKESFTVSLWCRPSNLQPGTTNGHDTNSSVDSLIGNYTNGNNDVFGLQTTKDEFGFYVECDSDNEYNTDPLPESVWTHVTARFGNGKIQIFFDGELKDSRSVSGDITDFGGVKTFAGSFGDQEAYLEGRLDDIRIYDRRLSNEEINQLYKIRSDRTHALKASEALTGLEAHYSFDNVDVKLQDSKPFKDLSLNGRDIDSGTLTQPDLVEGKINQAIQCVDNGGSSSKALVTPPMPNTQDLTLAAWVKADTGNIEDYVGLISNHSTSVGNGDGYRLDTLNNGARFIWNSQSGSTYEIMGGDLSDQQWHHVLVTVEAGERVTLYVDGAQVGENTQYTSIDYGGKEEEVLGIGCWQDQNGGKIFTGRLDDIRILSRSLSDAEVEKLANVTEPVKRYKV